MSFFKSKIFIFSLSVLTLLSPFIFSSATTLALSVIAGFYIPILPLFVGALVDILYYPGNTLPLGLVLGVSIFGITYGVRYLIRTRIM